MFGMTRPRPSLPPFPLDQRMKSYSLRPLTYKHKSIWFLSLVLSFKKKPVNSLKLSLQPYNSHLSIMYRLEMRAVAIFAIFCLFFVLHRFCLVELPSPVIFLRYFFHYSFLKKFTSLPRDEESYSCPS